MAKKQKKNKKRNVLPAAIILPTLLLVGLLYWYFSLKAPTLPDPPLKELAAQHKIDLGMLIYPDRLNDRIYPDLISSQFDFVAIDGGGHFKQVRPSPHKYDYSKLDKMVAFAETHHMPVQLHHLVWGDDIMLPKWLMEGGYTKEQLLEIQQSHITNMVKRYKGRVSEYTVINEAFTEAQHVYGLRSWWAEHLGDDLKYIDNYFIWAHQADPKAKLLINDFNNETKNSVSDAMYDYIKTAKARSVPIDGIGMQMHVDASRPFKKQDVIDNMKRFGAIGVPVYVTEFDINTNFVKDSEAYKIQLESQITHDMVRACIESKACVSFNVFGITSKNDLVKKLTRANSRALMFDSRYRPRQSFYDFRQAWLEP